MKGRYKINLQVFADASKKACAVACHGQTETNGQTSVILIASKTKVCGMKEVEKIPRLELVAALLAARLGKSIGSALGDVVGTTHWWSDSVIVLSWIRSHMPHLGHFVQRRLKEIRLLTNTASWHYVPSDSNPADIPSRGMRIKELKNSRLWWQGPEFLRRGKEQWPLDKAGEQLKVTAVATNIEREKTTCVLMVVDCRRYSRYSRLVKVVEQLLYLAELSRKMRFRQRFWEAEKRILASLQQLHFPQELSHLRTFKGKELSRIKELRYLKLFLSGDGLIRCNTRLHEAKFLSYDAKIPILLPASDHGRAFKGASEEMKEFVSFLCQEFAHPRVKWKFSVELAPWWGGFWERLVRSVKEPLRKVLGRQVIGYDELVTTVTEVEAVVNCRPLGYLYMDSPSDCLPLTPAHLVNGKGLLGSAVSIPVEAAQNINRRQQFLKSLVDYFWTIWTRDCLIELRQHHTNVSNGNLNPKVNDIVLLHEKRTRHCWRIGKISNLLFGGDGQARAAEVVSAGKTFRRPIQLISPLEVYK